MTDLLQHGPAAPVWSPVTDPDQRVGWMRSRGAWTAPTTEAEPGTTARPRQVTAPHGESVDDLDLPDPDADGAGSDFGELAGVRAAAGDLSVNGPGGGAVSANRSPSWPLLVVA